MAGYIRTDYSYYIQPNIFIIPTIEITKNGKFIEICFLFLKLCAYVTISHIDEDDYEP